MVEQQKQKQTIFQWAEENIGIKKLLFATLTFIVGGGASLGLEHTVIGDTVNEIVKPQIEESIRLNMENEVKKLIDEKVYAVLDSTLEEIAHSKKLSFREQLGRETGIPKDSVVYYIAKWYLKEKGYFQVGIFRMGTRILYRHTDGEVYVPAKDSSGMYYFLNPITGRTSWCY